MEPGFNIGVKFAESRKKKRGGTLENNIGNRKFAVAKMSSGRLWGSETDDTTESDSVNMEEEFLVEETSFDYGEDSILIGRDLEQTPKSSKIQTKRALGKPLEKIDFLDNDSDDIFLDKPVILSLYLKNLVNVSVRKSFALNISLDNVVGKFAQKKLMVIRKLFSKINGFGGAFIPSKFAKIIRATFTSELSLVQTFKKAGEVKILVNTDLKKLSGTSAETVHTVLSEFGTVMLIKMQLQFGQFWLFFGEKPILSVIVDIEKRFAILESSLTSLVGQISELAKKLNLFMLTVLQPSPGCQLLVTSSSQDQMGNVMIEKGSGGTTGGKTAVELVSSVSLKMKRLETMLEKLSALVLSLTARFDNLILAGGVFLNPFSQ
ncbi:hypothetical protein G9A89_004738 [Geosiphon pyriformis]|nr:hypothetical protein G9A89_004738 [Geosiphon pyriformis]